MFSMLHVEMQHNLKTWEWPGDEASKRVIRLRLSILEVVEEYSIMTGRVYMFYFISDVLM